MQQLTDTERAMLEVERLWWQYPGAKEQRVRDDFDLSTTQYYQRLNALLDRQEALAHDPLLVNRLRRMRDRRKRTGSVI